jgi:hypothetical protein
MKVRDAISPEVQLCTPDDTLKDAAEAICSTWRRLAAGH